MWVLDGIAGVIFRGGTSSKSGSMKLLSIFTSEALGGGTKRLSPSLASISFICTDPFVCLRLIPVKAEGDGDAFHIFSLGVVSFLAEPEDSQPNEGLALAPNSKLLGVLLFAGVDFLLLLLSRMLLRK